MGAGLDDDGRKVLRCGWVNTWIGVDGFQELVCGGMDSCPWPGRAAAFQTGYLKHYKYVSVQISGTGCRPHDASPPASDETGPVSASDEGTLPPWSVTGNQSAPHCGSHAAYREA